MIEGRSWLAWIVIAAIGMSACGGEAAPAADAGSGDGGGQTDAGGGERDGGGTSTRLDEFELEVATAQCAALFRCCDAGSIDEFFGQYACIPGLPCPFEALQDRLPPNDSIEEEECVPLMRELNAIAPFGVWLAEARAGRVSIDEPSHAACLEALENASCGEEVQAALYDARCFARLAAADPYGPARVDHVSFARTAGVGDPCVTVPEDPYGTCDPEVAFCCVRASEEEPCSTDGEGEAGTCVGVASLGEACSFFPAQPCAPGLHCPPGADIEDPTFCAEPNDTPLDTGDVCLEQFQPIGVCPETDYCDFATERCQTKKALDESCEADEQCESGECGGDPLEGFTCRTPTFCVGR